MYHETVEVIDSIYAVILVDTGMEPDSTILNLNLNMNDTFPESPSRSYQELLQIILEKLSLPDILETEMSIVKTFQENRKRSRFFPKRNSKNSDTEMADDTNQNKENIEKCKGDQSVSSTKSVIQENPETNHKENVASLIEQDKHHGDMENDLGEKNSCIEENSKIQHLKRKSDSYTDNDEGYDTVSLIQSNCKDISSHLTLGRNNTEEMTANSSAMQGKIINSNSNQILGKIVSQKNAETDEKENRSLAAVNEKTFSYKSCTKTDPAKRSFSVVDSKISTMTKSKSSDLVENDVEILKFMPGVNDDFNIDLDFDWDNFKQDGCQNSTMSQKDSLRQKTLQTKRSNNTQSSSNNLIGSSVSSMFEVEEDVELDFDINL